MLHICIFSTKSTVCKLLDCPYIHACHHLISFNHLSWTNPNLALTLTPTARRLRGQAVGCGWPRWRQGSSSSTNQANCAGPRQRKCREMTQTTHRAKTTHMTPTTHQPCQSGPYPKGLQPPTQTSRASDHVGLLDVTLTYEYHLICNVFLSLLYNYLTSKSQWHLEYRHLLPFNYSSLI